MGTEFELKYRADRAGLEEIRAAFPGAWAVIPMETTYYDTVSGDISCRRWTLRHRLEGETRVCTLKTPAPGGARGEWEVTGQSIGGALPELARLSGEVFLETLIIVEILFHIFTCFIWVSFCLSYFAYFS